ncbi:hypothetical protein SLEP1_g4312 [Rubroshorea leprosula]|uniref:Uncharacterized protein n=1 Tax=Rubroshorea leprosula TaxID=152421 RepID=A0AAV5HNB3_9ROSI|nr:hypothetical protein SLEP1_g4312 [Rubroshorea leprosula]
MCFTIKSGCFKCACGGDGDFIDFTLALFVPPTAILKRKGVGVGPLHLFFFLFIE